MRAFKARRHVVVGFVTDALGSEDGLERVEPPKPKETVKMAARAPTGIGRL
jgi:hypothetical protein